jgi:Flp pilus assembly secretin CpaC
MRRILGTIGLLALVTGSIARGDDSADTASGGKTVEIVQQVKAKEAQVAALQNELEQMRREAGLASQILLKVKIVEIDETLMRKSGLGFRFNTPEGPSVEKEAQLKEITDKLQAADKGAVASPGRGNMQFMTLPANHAFFAFLDALEKQGLATTLCAPNIISESGRPSTFRSGGEFPLAPGAPAKNVTMKFYGTSLDCVARSLADHRARVDVHIALSTIHETRSVTSGGGKIPALKLTEFNTAFEGRLGETLLCAGLTQERDFAAPGDQSRKGDAGTDKDRYQLLVLITPEAVTDVVATKQQSPAK